MMRVGVAGAPGILRTGLEALVRADADMQLAFTADSLEELAASADVIVALDPELDSLSLAASSPVVVIAPVNTESIAAALRAGARSVLPSDCTTKELTAALEAAVAGLTVLRTADAEALVRATVEEPRATVTASVLSPRETEVLRLLADGLANKEIGYKLGISEHTVKFHVNSIMTRLNASSRAEAVAIGLRTGLILL